MPIHTYYVMHGRTDGQAVKQPWSNDPRDIIDIQRHRTAIGDGYIAECGVSGGSGSPMVYTWCEDPQRARSVQGLLTKHWRATSSEDVAIKENLVFYIRNMISNRDGSSCFTLQLRPRRRPCLLYWSGLPRSCAVNQPLLPMLICTDTFSVARFAARPQRV